MRADRKSWAGWIAALALAGCGSEAKLQVEDGTGPDPQLPPPADEGYVPVVNIAPAVGWAEGETPVVAAGNAGLRLRRPPRPSALAPRPAERGRARRRDQRARAPVARGARGIKGWVMGKVMKRAGAAVPSANRITLLRDADGDGRADLRSVLLAGLNSPFGMALVGDQLYVANTDALVRFPYRPGSDRDRGARAESGGPSRRPAESPLDQERHCEHGRLEALRHGRLEQQRRRARHGRGSDRAAILEIDARPARASLCIRPSQSERYGLGARDRMLWTS